jgi:hypothetical protein
MPRPPVIPLEIQAEVEKLVEEFNRNKFKKLSRSSARFWVFLKIMAMRLVSRANFFIWTGSNEATLHPSAGLPGPVQWINGTSLSTNIPTTITIPKNGFSQGQKR